MTRFPFVRRALVTLLASAAMTAVAQAADTAALPDSISLPRSVVRIVLYADGVQEYQCAPLDSDAGKGNWKLVGPDAQLYEDAGHTRLFGTHFAGPNWRAQDGSQLTGKARSSVPSPQAGSVPWLLLDVKSTGATGVLSDIVAIQRVYTAGGAAPMEPCKPGDAHLRVQYTAQYWLLAPAP